MREGGSFRTDLPPARLCARECGAGAGGMPDRGPKSGCRLDTDPEGAYRIRSDDGPGTLAAVLMSTRFSNDRWEALSAEGGMKSGETSGGGNDGSGGGRRADRPEKLARGDTGREGASEEW